MVMMVFFLLTGVMIQVRVETNFMYLACEKNVYSLKNSSRSLECDKQSEFFKYVTIGSVLKKNAFVNVRIRSTPLAGDRRIEMIAGEEFAFRWCPPGTFFMGSPKDELSRGEDEELHAVTLTRGYWILESEVTQRQWQAVMENNPSYDKGLDRPVENVSWEEATAFCKKMKEISGKDFRLPTEAEWEYACRAGTITPFHYGTRFNSNMANIDGRGPYGGSANTINRYRSVNVKSFKPNNWGIYDMHGNVEEWCSDWKAVYEKES